MRAAKGHFIRHRWLEGNGPAFASTDPASGETVWEGRAATPDEVDLAVRAARESFVGWSELSPEARIGCLEAFRGRLSAQRDALAEAISRETGKPLWESRSEVDGMAGKVDASVDAYRTRRCPVERVQGGVVTAARFKPHGVVAVLGPFNMPGHLPNGHIVPALLAGNTVVFKPSELAPRVAEKTVDLWEAAGIPPGVLNMVQGGAATGAALAQHSGLDGLFFTGGTAAGSALHRAFAGRPGKVLALEMGGNNPLIVAGVFDLKAAAVVTVLSAYLTAGQRCSCARRLIVPTGEEGDRFVARLLDVIAGLRQGCFTEVPEPFMGPVISPRAAETLLSAQAMLAERGGTVLAEMAPRDGRPAMLSPGLIDVTRVPDRPDVERFGPLLQLVRMPDFDAALREANATSYGLTAGLLSDSERLYRLFFRMARAGVLYWNRPLTGASLYLPFGGVGDSGNHRPSGYYAADYCSYPVASIEVSALSLPDPPVPGLPP